MVTQKTKKKKKRKKKRYLLKTLILGLFLYGLYAFLSSSVFDIQTISVENNAYFTSEQIIELAGAKTGQNLIAADTALMKDKLLAEPYIKSVVVKRRPPSEIVISVEERKETVAIPYQNHYILIDPDGMILRQVESEPALTIISGLTLQNRDLGTPLQAEENAMLSDTLKMLKLVEENELYFKKIDISSVVIKAYVYDSLVCEGTPTNIGENIIPLKDVLADLYKKGIERGNIKIGSDGYVSFNPMVE